MKLNIFFLLLFGSFMALAGPSSSTKLVGGFLKNGSNLFQIPNTGGPDQLVMRTSTDTLTNKTMDGATNTWTNIPANTAFGSSITPVANGGTGLASGTSGGVLAYTASGTLASSGALTANQLVIGGGAGVVPSSLAAGSQYQSLVMGATTPGYGQVNLGQSAAITGVLPIANGGTNNGSLSVSTGQLLYTDGTKVNTIATGGAGQMLLWGSPPAWGHATPTHQILTSTGSQAGYVVVASGNVTIAPGCVFSNNSVNYTTIQTTTAATKVYFSGTGTLNSTSMVYVSGGAGCNGAASFTCAGSACFTAGTAMAAYTTPANATLIKVVSTGGGGSGGGVTSTASDSCAGGGGGGGGTCIKYITSPGSTFYYTVAGGASASSGGGVAGNPSYFVSTNLGGQATMIAGGGGAGTVGTPTVLGFTTPGGASSSSGCDVTMEGSPGSPGIVLNGTTQACGGQGGGTAIKSGFIAPQCNTSAVGTGGAANTGQGSNGGVNINAGGAQNSGNSGTGLIVVEEYYQ